MPTPTAPPPLTVVSGDEELLVSRAVAGVLAAVRNADPQAEIVDHEPGSFGDGDLMNLSSPSMFGGLRAAVVRAAQDLPDTIRDGLIAYANRRPVPDDVVLVVVHSGGVRNKKIIDAMKTAGAKVFAAAKVTRPRDRQDFVTAEVRRLGGKISHGAVVALVDAVGSDLRELAAVCEQVVEDTGGPIDEQTVARYHRGRAETTGFAVADAAIAGDLPEALTLLRQALQHATAPVLVSSAVAGGLRDVARVAAAGGGSRYEIARALGMPDWKVDRAQRAARAWSDEGLRRAIQASARADADLKGAGVDSAFALERLVSTIVASRGRGARR